MQAEIIDVQALIGTESAVSTEDGNKVFIRLDEHFQAGKKVELDFSKIKTIISAFLNAAIGQLYSKYKSDFLNGHLTIAGLSPEDVILLKKVIERAKEYFIDRSIFEKNVNKFLGNE